MISADMTVARLLEEHPELVEVLAGYHAHFKQLRNRLLRRVMAPRVTVAQAARMAGVPTDELLGANGSHELWQLVLDASRLDEVVEQVVRSLEFSVLAKYAFAIAQAFNAFYHRSPILNEERDDVRRWRGAAIIYVRYQLTRALDLMGIGVPPRM